MDENKVHFRHLMLFYFHKGKNAAQSAKKICQVYGHDTVGESTVRKWFARFKSGDFNLKDQARPGRPVIVDDDQIATLIENNPHYTTRDIGEILRISQISAARHLEALGYVNHYDVWVPRALSEKHLIARISICDSLLRRNRINPFLRRIITGDEKWIVYNGAQRKRPSSQRDEPPSLAPSKRVLLCVWWDWKGVVHLELLPQGQTLDSDKYCAQLNRLNAAIEEKRPELLNQKGVIFHQDHTRSRTSLKVRQKLLQFEWEVLPHPPYSPDLAPSDYHLFQSLQNSLDDKNFTSTEACKGHLDQFIAERESKFWKDGIMKLPHRWQRVVEQNGAYVVE